MNKQIVDVTNIKLTGLPGVSLGDKNNLSTESGIYFVFTNELLMYVGIAKNIRKRWNTGGHHRTEFFWF